MKRVFLTALFLFVSGMGFATVQEEQVLYSTSSIIVVSSTAWTAIVGLNGQKNIELYNLDSTDGFIFASSNPVPSVALPGPGPKVVAGESRFWDDFRGDILVIAEPDKGSVAIGIFRQMFRKHPASY